MTTLGELAASIAHEVNQPLAAIVADANASLNWLFLLPFVASECTWCSVTKDGEQ